MTPPGVISMTEISIKSMNIVIVGKHHNPAILNHDYLRHNAIVPESCTPAGPVMCTSIASRIDYEGGMHIESNPDRIHFVNAWSEDKPIKIPGIALNYLKVESSVPYTAVGLNWQATIDSMDGQLTTAALLRGGDWMNFEETAPDAAIKLTHKLSEGRIINTDVQQDQSGSIVFSGNFHHPIRSEDTQSYRIAKSIINEWESALNDFRKLVSIIAKGMLEK